MVKFDRNNEFSFGVKYNIPSAVLLKAEGNVFESSIIAVVADAENNAILRTLLDIAKKNGITDLIVLDEEKIKDVFEKRVPKQPLYIDGDYGLPLCPCCCLALDEADADNYCSVCGQAIDWNEEKKVGAVNDKIKAINPQIIVTGTVEKPYYEIQYYDTADKTWHIGYSSYDLSIVVKWKQECFEVVGRMEDMKEGSVDG